MKRTICFTDLHGCFDELLDLFELIKYSPHQDSIITMSDFCDKGPHPGKVIQEIYDIQKNYNNVQCILANHEDKHIRFQRNELEKEKSGKPNKIKTHPDFLETRKQLLELPFDVFAWFKTFPLFIKNEFGTFVHAGKIPGITISKQDKGILTHIRNIRKDENGNWKMLHINEIDETKDPFWAAEYQGEDGIIYYGHSPQFTEGYRIDKYAFGLDGGIFADGFLTCMVLETRQIYKVKARKKYANRFREE